MVQECRVPARCRSVHWSVLLEDQLMAAFRDFEEIVAWQQAVALAGTVNARFKDHRDFSFRDRSGGRPPRSPATSREGFDRGSNKDFRRFLDAGGSCNEVRSLLWVAHAHGYLNESERDELRIECRRWLERIQSPIRSLLDDAVPASSPLVPTTRAPSFPEMAVAGAMPFHPRTFPPPAPPSRHVRKGDRRTIRGWVMYDWANRSILLTITTAIFPVFYLAVTHVDGQDLVPSRPWHPGAIAVFHGALRRLPARRGDHAVAQRHRRPYRQQEEVL